MNEQAPKRKRLEGLMDEPPINLYPSLAKRTGTDKAAILQQIHFLCSVKERAEQGKEEDNLAYYNGQWWVYNTLDEWIKRYFPWLSLPTIKRKFQELEFVGILLSRTYEKDERTKWYAINRDYWDEWYAIDPAVEAEAVKAWRKKGSKRSLNRDQTDPDLEPDTDQTDPKNGDQNDPDLEPDADQNDPDSINMDSTEITQTENTSTEITSTTEMSGEGSTPPTSQDVDDDILRLIRPEIQKLLLSPEKQTELLSRGPVQALAIARAAQRGKRPGGLAVDLMRKGGPPDDDLKWAQIAIAHKTLDDQVIDRALRTGDLGTLNEDVKACLYAKLPAEPPDESLTKPVQAERSLWQAYKETLSTLEYDPRVSPESYALLTGLRLVRFDDVARVLVVTGDPSAAWLLEQNLAWRTGEPITVQVEEIEEVST